MQGLGSFVFQRSDFFLRRASLDRPLIRTRTSSRIKGLGLRVNEKDRGHTISKLSIERGILICIRIRDVIICPSTSTGVEFKGLGLGFRVWDGS